MTAKNSDGSGPRAGMVLGQISTSWTSLNDPLKFVMTYGLAVHRYLLALLRNEHTDILSAVRDSRDLDDATGSKLKNVVENYAKTFA